MYLPNFFATDKIGDQFLNGVWIQFFFSLTGCCWLYEKFIDALRVLLFIIPDTLPLVSLGKSSGRNRLRRRSLDFDASYMVLVALSER